MEKVPPKPTERLSMREASGFLGISASTLRRWSDRHMIPSSKTPGGHRRYDREDIERLAQQLTSHSIPALTATSYSVPSPDWHISAEYLSVQPWHAHLAPPYDTGSTMRALGQRILGLLIQYITRSQDDPRFLEEAPSCTIGSSGTTGV